MSGTEDKITLPPDSTGKNQRERKLTLGSQIVYEDVVALDDGNGNLVDPRPIPECIIGEMLFPSYDLNRVFMLRVSGFGVKLDLADVNTFLLPSSFTLAHVGRNAVFLEEYNAIYSKRLFKYGSFTYYAQVPLNSNSSWLTLWLGAESTGLALGGIASFCFSRSTTLESFVQLAPMGGVTAASIEISALISDPSAALHTYCVKVNKASAEYYVDGVLVGIIQCADEASTYDVRLTAPYVLHQCKGQMPTHMPSLTEIVASDTSFIGTQPGFDLSSVSIVDGEPSPCRTLSAITGGASWAGTVISSGTLTSDGIPVAGYDEKTVLFIATGAGTLYIDVDYGDNNYDQYGSVAVTANTLIVYPMTANPLWLRLRFTPTAYPTTVTRARVSMS